MREVEEKESTRAQDNAVRAGQARDALKEAWREHRLIAHRNALAAAHAAFSEIEGYQIIVGDRPQLEVGPGSDDSLRAAVLDAIPEVELLGSTDAWMALRNFESLLSRYHRATKLSGSEGSIIEPPYSPTGEPQGDRWDDITALGDTLMGYQHAARKDLGTLD